MDNDILEKGDIIFDAAGAEREALLPRAKEGDSTRSTVKTWKTRRDGKNVVPLLASFVLGILLTTALQRLCPTCFLFSSPYRPTSLSYKDLDTKYEILADPDAGSTTRHAFPPPSPTGRPTSLFPTDVGYAGPTPTGGEPALVMTAPSYPVQSGVQNLIAPTKLPGAKDIGEKQKERKQFDLFRMFGNLSPWYSVESERFGGQKMRGASGRVPEGRGCVIDGLHLLHRHGARYPTNYSRCW